jgi:hypothetical protein
MTNRVDFDDFLHSELARLQQLGLDVAGFDADTDGGDGSASAKKKMRLSDISIPVQATLQTHELMMAKRSACGVGIALVLIICSALLFQRLNSKASLSQLSQARIGTELTKEEMQQAASLLEQSIPAHHHLMPDGSVMRDADMPAFLEQEKRQEMYDNLHPALQLAPRSQPRHLILKQSVPAKKIESPHETRTQMAKERPGSFACTADKNCSEGQECYMGGTEHAACVAKGSFGMGAPEKHACAEDKDCSEGQECYMGGTEHAACVAKGSFGMGVPATNVNITSGTGTTKVPTFLEVDKPSARCNTNQDCAATEFCFRAGALDATCVDVAPGSSEKPSTMQPQVKQLTHIPQPPALISPTVKPSRPLTADPSIQLTHVPAVPHPPDAEISVVQLLMSGSIASYGSASLEKMKISIAAYAACKASEVSLKIKAGSVIIFATMPALAASKLVTSITSGQIKSLGGNQVSSAVLVHAPSRIDQTSVRLSACSTIHREMQCIDAHCAYCCDAMSTNGTLRGCFATKAAAKAAQCMLPSTTMCNQMEFPPKRSSLMALAIAATCGVTAAVLTGFVVTYIRPRLQQNRARQDSDETRDEERDALYMKFPSRAKRGPYAAATP